MIKKWILWAAAALVVIGCGIGGMAMQALDWDFKRLDTENGEWKQWEFSADEIKTISAEAEMLPVRTERSEDGFIHVLAYASEQTEVQAEQQGDALDISVKIRPTHLFSFHMFRGLKTMLNGIVIQIPNGYTGDVALMNENGSVTVSELKILGNLSVSNGNGRIVVNETEAYSLNAVNTNGSVRLEKVTVQEEVKTSNSNGSTKIEEVRAKAAEFRGSNGGVSLEEVTASDCLQAQNNNGSIRIEEIFAPSLSLRNSNGSIKGNIAGRQADWRIVNNIKNGSSNLNSNADINRPYLLQAENNNGSIKINFTNQP